jgi:hypothetical protein
MSQGGHASEEHGGHDDGKNFAGEALLVGVIEPATPALCAEGSRRRDETQAAMLPVQCGLFVVGGAEEF